MISIKSSINNRPNFTGKVSIPKLLIPTVGLACCLSSTPLKADTFSKSKTTTELLDSLKDTEDSTMLDSAELAHAPSPVVTIAGKKQSVGIVVDVTKNKLFR